MFLDVLGSQMSQGRLEIDGFFWGVGLGNLPIRYKNVSDLDPVTVCIRSLAKRTFRDESEWLLPPADCSKTASGSTF